VNQVQDIVLKKVFDLNHYSLALIAPNSSDYWTTAKTCNLTFTLSAIIAKVLFKRATTKRCFKNTQKGKLYKYKTCFSRCF